MGDQNVTWFVFSLGGMVLGFFGKKEAEKVGDKTGRTLSLVGLGLGVLGVVLGIVVWILAATGAIDPTEWYNIEATV